MNLKPLVLAVLPALALAVPSCKSSSSGGSAVDEDAGTSPEAGADAAAPSPLCIGIAAPCSGFSEGAAESDVANAIATAQTGSTFVFGPGTFAFTNTLTFAATHVTVKGAGIGQTTLDFKGLASGSSGIGIDVLDGSDGFAIRDIAVRDPVKNGIKVKGSTGVTFHAVKVSWSAADPRTHGDYAIYPVFCKNVLVESSDISGSSDAGIYVGQSQGIIVKNNTSHDNVAGIEIENSYNADVFGNTVKNNTAGLLVFDVPGAGNQHDGHNVHVHMNIIDSNNTPNFNATGSIVAKVPAGTGSFVLGTRDVEFDHNTYSNNMTTAFSVDSYYVADSSWTSAQDPLYQPISKRVFVHDNTMTGNGTSPDLKTQLGAILSTGKNVYPNGHVPDQLVDGIVDMSMAATGAPTGNPMFVCFSNNGTADFAICTSTS